jgi:hypothetical protein
MPSSTVENYLKAILHLQKDGCGSTTVGEIARELLIVLSFFKPVIDLRRLMGGHEVDGAPFDTATERSYCKVIETVCESVPSSVIAMVALLSGRWAWAPIVSIGISWINTAFKATSLSFDLDIPFAVPFAYSGAAALVVEVRIVNDPRVSHLVDSYGEEGNSVPPIDLGTGCVTGFLPFLQDASLTTRWVPSQRGEVVWDLRALFAPVALPGFFVIGNHNPVTVPGMCETVFPTLDLVLPADQFVSGPVAINTVPRASTPFSVGMIGMEVTVQSAAIDPSQPVMPYVMSQAQILTVAPLPAQPLPIASLRGSIGNALADELVYGGRVLQFEF